MLRPLWPSQSERVTMQGIHHFLRDETGASVIDAGLVIGGMSAASYVAWNIIGHDTESVLGTMANMLPSRGQDESGHMPVITPPMPLEATSESSQASPPSFDASPDMEQGQVPPTFSNDFSWPEDASQALPE